MKRVSRWIITTISTALVVVAVIGMGAVFAQEPESTPTPVPQEQETTPAAPTDEPEDTTPDAPADEPKGQGLREWRGGLGAKGDELAAALGITVDELQAAQQEAFAASVQQAVDQGLLTQDEAEQMLSGERGHGFPHGVRGADIDHDALLADALGISVETLEAAEEQARAASLAAAVAEGRITQEQADLMQAREALEGYVDHDSILAQALGMSVEELEAAEAAGQRPDEIAEAKGLDREALHTAMQGAVEAAVSQAVSDGVISQTQADQLLSGEGLGGHGFGGRHGGRGFGRPGRGGPSDESQGTPSTVPSSDT